MNDKQHLAQLKRIEAKHFASVYRPLNSVTKKFIDALRSGGVIAANNSISDLVIIDGLITPIRSIYKRVGLMGAIQTYGKLPKEARRKGYTPNEIEVKRSASFGFNQEWIDSINEFFNSRKFLQYAVTPISRNYRDMLQRLLQQGVEKGMTVQQMIDLIYSKELATWKARQIIRTESVAAYGLGQYLGADSSPFYMVKEWHEIKDARTRRTHTHAFVGGEKRDLNERFSNGLLFPGDKVPGKASEVVNCRCRLALTPKRDANGRLIRKPKDPNRVAAQVALNSVVGTALSLTFQSLINNLIVNE